MCGNERSVGMREEKRPRSYGSAPAARLFPSLHHLSSLSLSPPRILSSASGKQTRGREEEIGWKTKVVETPREGEIARNAAKETQERAIYGAA